MFEYIISIYKEFKFLLYLVKYYLLNRLVYFYGATEIDPEYFKKDAPHDIYLLFPQNVRFETDQYLFVSSLETRGIDNEKKKIFVEYISKYVHKLNSIFLHNAQDIVNECILQKKPLFSTVSRKHIEMYLHMHFGQKSQILVEFSERVVYLLSNYPQSKLFWIYLKHVVLKETVYRELLSQIKKSKPESFSWYCLQQKIEPQKLTNDILHHLVAMVIQLNRLYYQIYVHIHINKFDITDTNLKTPEYTLEFFRKYPISTINVSRCITDYSNMPNNFLINIQKYKYSVFAVHDSSANYNKKYFKDPDNFDLSNIDMSKLSIKQNKTTTQDTCVIPAHSQILLQKGYCPFGFGYRRCAFETTCVDYATDILMILKSQKIKFYTDTSIKKIIPFTFMQETNDNVFVYSEL